GRLRLALPDPAPPFRGGVRAPRRRRMERGTPPGHRRRETLGAEAPTGARSPAPALHGVGGLAPVSMVRIRRTDPRRAARARIAGPRRGDDHAAAPSNRLVRLGPSGDRRVVPGGRGGSPRV